MTFANMFESVASAKDNTTVAALNIIKRFVNVINDNGYFTCRGFPLNTPLETVKLI